jgi:O-antigen/teichoic acid export membrane protein
LQIGAQALLLPFILRVLPQETVGIWTIFTTIIALVNLLDFGFNPSFMRNVTYVFSGAKVLKAKGFEAVEENAEIDYGLLKSLIAAMRFFYSRMAMALFFVLASAGTFYIHIILNNYTGSHAEVYGAWLILCVINVYSFYTLYYDALLQGKGLIKRAKQIMIAGQSVYLIAAVILMSLGFGLTAIVGAQAVSIIIRRILSYRTFYTAEIKKRLLNIKEYDRKNILKSVYPNAVKLGLTSIGSFLADKSAVIIGSFYLQLEIIASYGITYQIIIIIRTLGEIYHLTFLPKITEYRIQGCGAKIINIYITGIFTMSAVYIVFGTGLLMFGNRLLQIIGSKTVLLRYGYIFMALIVNFLDSNQRIAAGILSTKNEIPFFKSFLVSGVFSVLLLFVMLKFLHIGIWALILASGIVQCVYQNWKWPYELIKELRRKNKCLTLSHHG